MTEISVRAGNFRPGRKFPATPFMADSRLSKLLGIELHCSTILIDGIQKTKYGVVDRKYAFKYSTVVKEDLALDVVGHWSSSKYLLFLDSLLPCCVLLTICIFGYFVTNCQKCQSGRSSLWRCGAGCAG